MDDKIVIYIFLVFITTSIAVGVTSVGVLDRDDAPTMTEIQYSTNPLVADTDDDGLNDSHEINGPTSATLADTDRDGLDDGREVNGPTNATLADTDRDRLNDSREINGPTNATLADTDRDGLNDSREINGPTNATLADTDGDGLDDGREIELGADPTAVDSDKDGLEDGAEIRYYSNVTNKDTDDDGLIDGEEVNKYGTDPTEIDTDGDLLTDRREIKRFGTDPTNEDTDNDRIVDGFEVREENRIIDEKFTGEAILSADPLRKDIYVEVDYMEGHKPSTQALEMVEDVYRNSPVENPDGTTGISLHISINESIPSEDHTSTADRNRLMKKYYDKNDQLHHYALAVKNATLFNDSFRGVALGGHFIFQTEGRTQEYRSSETASLFMHELGHSVGLGACVYEGIDSHNISYDRYNSVMNYNSPADSLRYSSGEPFDDWEYIEHNLLLRAPIPELGTPTKNGFC